MRSNSCLGVTVTDVCLLWYSRFPIGGQYSQTLSILPSLGYDLRNPENGLESGRVNISTINERLEKDPISKIGVTELVTGSRHRGRRLSGPDNRRWEFNKQMEIKLELFDYENLA